MWQILASRNILISSQATIPILDPTIWTADIKNNEELAAVGTAHESDDIGYRRFIPNCSIAIRSLINYAAKKTPTMDHTGNQRNKLKRLLISAKKSQDYINCYWDLIIDRVMLLHDLHDLILCSWTRLD